MITALQFAQKLAPSCALHGNQPAVPPLAVLFPERYARAVGVVPQIRLERLSGGTFCVVGDHFWKPERMPYVDLVNLRDGAEVFDT